MKHLLTFVVLLLAPFATLTAAEFHIAPNGKDTNPGTRDQPFATLEAARDAVRGLNAAKKDLSEGVTVWIRGGVYERSQAFVLDARDSGLPSAPVVYAAAPGESVRICGGVRIPARAFHPVTDPAFLGRVVSRAARRHLIQVDLKALGILDYGELQPMHAVDFGSNTHYVPAGLELFIDGKPAVPARWPNRKESVPALSVVEAAVQEMVRNEKGDALEYSTITFKDVPTKSWGIDGDGDQPAIFAQQAIAHLKLWGPQEDAFVVGGLVRAYANTHRRIASTDPQKGTVTFATPVKVWPTYKDMAKWFYFSNVPDEIDVPGEYYLDRKTGLLTLYPPADWSERSEVSVSLLKDVLVAMEGCSHVRFRGVTIEATRTSGVYIQGGEDNVLERCIIRNTGIVGVQIGYGWDAGIAGEWEARNSRGAEVPAEVKTAGPGAPLPRLPGSYRHVLCTGMERLPNRLEGATAWDRKGGRRNGLDHCVITDTGIGGVLLGGGDRRTLTPAENFVRDCDISRTDRRVHMYAEAVVVDGCGNVVEGNYLHDNLGGLLYFLGNDHLMQFNEICRGLRGSKDGGVIETRQNPSMLGNRLRYNYVHHNERGSPDHNAGNCSVYLDNSTHGVEVFGNVFYENIGRTVSPWSRAQIGVTEGHCHVVANNLFIDNPGVKVKDGADFATTGKTFQACTKMLRADVDVTAEPYASRYPEFLKTYLGVSVDKNAATPLFNSVYNNALIGNNEGVGTANEPDSGRRHHNIEIDVDPGFVDEAGGNFALRPDSRVFREIPGFEPIPFEKMQRSKILK